MLGKHPCMSCHEELASVKLTKLVKGSVEEVWLCPKCAAKQSPYQKKVSAMSLDQILASLLSQGQGGESAARPGASVDLSCSTCGLPFDSYRSTLLLGCSDCYESFEKYLMQDLRKFHGSTRHRGRVPSGEPPQTVAAPQPSPADLQKRLRDAVESEDFELAARLRDELRKLQASVGGAQS